MSLKDLLSLKINLFSRSRTENFDDTEFRRIIEIKQIIKNEETGEDEEVTRKAVKTLTEGSSGRITLIPMKSLSLEEFSFPFANNTKIRDALRLQVLPFSAAGELEIFPVTLTKTGRGANGLVWYVSPDELAIPSINSDKSNSSKNWPAPLPFISQLEDYDGSGVTMWIDEENVCSLLWQNNKPVLYRWRKLIDDTTEQKELAWYDAYCKSKELERGGNFVVYASGDDEVDEEFNEIISESVKICPWINDVNLSRSVLEGAKDLERIVRLLTRASCWLLVFGIVMLGAGLLRWYQLQNQVQEVRTRSENYYRQVFDPQHTGRIANPVSLARDKIASLTGTAQEGKPLENVLADLGDIFTEGQSLDVTLDVIRYNSEGIDCTGVAPDMSTVLNFRKAWETRARLSQVDNTQFVSGIGYRFDLRVRW